MRYSYALPVVALASLCIAAVPTDTAAQKFKADEIAKMQREIATLKSQLAKVQAEPLSQIKKEMEGNAEPLAPATDPSGLPTFDADNVARMLENNRGRGSPLIAKRDAQFTAWRNAAPKIGDMQKLIKKGEDFEQVEKDLGTIIHLQSGSDKLNVYNLASLYNLTIYVSDGKVESFQVTDPNR